MKILHLSSERGWRGGEQQVAYLIEELNRLGVENIVACRDNSSFANRCKSNGWPYHSLAFRSSLDLSTAWAIKKICRKENVDLIHIHSGKSHGIAVLSATLGNATPLVLSRRVDFSIRRNRMTKWKYNHPQIFRIISISRAIDRMVRTAIRRPEKCTTVYSGIDINRFSHATGYLRKTYQIPSSTMLIGNTSALADHKDYSTFIKTAKILNRAGFKGKFFIIGDGPLRASIYRDIVQRQLQNDVIMTGFLENISEVLPELDIFLMTSKTEGLGTSVLDAFACRVPVVATRAGGIPEMVIHEKTGMLADIGDTATLAKYVKFLADQPNIRKQLVEGAYEHLLYHFTREKMARGTLDVYQSALTDATMVDFDPE